MNLRNILHGPISYNRMRTRIQLNQMDWYYKHSPGDRIRLGVWCRDNTWEVAVVVCEIGVLGHGKEGRGAVQQIHVQKGEQGIPQGCNTPFTIYTGLGFRVLGFRV